MQLVWLNVLTTLINNPVNTFLINPNIILYYFPFIKYVWIYKISLVSIELKSTEKKVYTFF